MIVAALLARNEAAPDRYLKRCVTNALSYCDGVVCVDDGSTDATASVVEQVARDMGKPAIVAPAGSQAPPEGFWGRNETSPRALLWELAAREAGARGWIYVFDADHELCGLSPEDFTALTRAERVSAWAWPLWDCWEQDTLHRVDGYWQAWRSPRPWLFRANPQPRWSPQWHTPRGIHTGHCPPNYPLVVSLAPGAIRHLGYVSSEHRHTKSAKYLALA